MPSAMNLRIPRGVRRDDGAIDCYPDESGGAAYLSVESAEDAAVRPDGAPVSRVRIDRGVTRDSVLADLGVEV